MTPPKPKAVPDEPRALEITVSHSGGGAVALMEYSKVKSDWSIFFSRRYAIPEGWTEEQVDDFQLQLSEKLHNLIEPIDQAELDSRLKEADWT